MKQAEVYSMKTGKHICPYGLKSKDLLRRKGYAVKEHPLSTSKEIEAFKKKHCVKTTPQIFIKGKRIGGYEDLKEFLGASLKNKTSYTPVIAIFSTTFLMALALTWTAAGGVVWSKLFEAFISLSMCVLAVQKLRDLEEFSLQFLGYDLLAQKWVVYSLIYPFAEAAAGIGMLWGQYPYIFASIALFIGTVGAVSVFKAVYIDKRELKCACVGGNSNVPLGFISLTENIMMLVMAIWMFSK